MHKPASPMHKRVQDPASGLTLLELVMTLAVLAVLGTLALPSLGPQLERSRLRDAAQALAGDIAEARYLAVQRAQTVYIRAQPGPQWCWAVSLEPNCECAADATRPTACAIHVTRAADRPGATLGGDLSITLDATGVPAAVTRSTLLAPHGDTLRVDVTALGRPRICAAVGKWPSTPACP
jgi:type IV fimbrial biogenesis protein FimT